MESCHSVFPPIGKYVPHPPTYRRLPPKIHSTLGHLIEILEQLSSKEELSSVLRSIVAESDGTSPANGCGSARVDLDPETIIKVAQILCKLNPNYTTMATTTETEETKMVVSSANLEDVSRETPGKGVKPSGGEWAPRTIDCKNLSLSKQDSLYLVKKIRDFEQKCKPLQEKNKKFLERNMELTTLNRNLKEQIRNIMEENKKLKECAEQNKRKCSTLSQQLGKEKTEKETMATQIQQLGEMKTQLIEQCKTINQLKQASQEKDRRMEVLQQRKKRRLRKSAEQLSRLSSPCSGVDDDRSVDSDLSMSSISAGTLSDEDLLEELPHDEVEKTEKKFKCLMKEHLALQKSMAKLQGIIGKSDPERFLKMRTTFETDMYIAQCKIDSLEESLERYKESDYSWVREKDQLSSEINSLSSQNKSLTDKLKEMTESVRELTQAYEDIQEQKEELEFLILETQSTSVNKIEKPQSCDVSTETDTNQHGQLCRRDQTKNEKEDDFRVKELETQLEMAEEQRKQYQATIATLEKKLSELLQGQGSEVVTVMDQLKEAEKHVVQVESTMLELQNKVVCLQEEKSVLANKLDKCKEKLDAQEQSLSLTRDEREELLQVKPKSSGIHLNSRLRLAEVGHDRIRERSLERERPLERIKCSSPLPSPRISRTLSETSIDSLSTIACDRPGEDETVLTVSNFDVLKPLGFEKDTNNVTGTENDLNDDMFFDELSPRRPRMNSVPVLSSTMTLPYEFMHEVDRLQKQITDLKEENDVLRYEASQKCHSDGEGSGSDSEDPRSVELRETCEKLRERAQTAEALERQYKDRLKLAEKHIGELEVSESVLRDRVEEGNVDCDKLRKQIIRLQRKIRELKEVAVEKENNEQTLLDKVKYLEETDSILSQKVTELEENNNILKQRLDLKDELLGDADFGENLKDRMKTLESENAGLTAKVIEMEEDNDMLRENWRKVADEEANRRECLEDKIRVLENSNRELKDKIKEQETDLDLSACQSIASEINDDVIENLNERIRDLENQLQSLTEEKNEKIETLENSLDVLKQSELRLSETVIEMEQSERQLKSHITILEKSDESGQAVSTVVGYEKKINELKSSQENLLEALDTMEDHEDSLKQRLIDMEKSYEKKIDMLEREIAEYQQQEEDLCTRVEELVETENNLLEKIERYKESEMNFRNKIEEYENRETSLTVSFSQRMEELERVEKEKSDNLTKRVNELENTQAQLNSQVHRLTSEKEDLVLKLSSLEKHDSELSEKENNRFHEQINSELVKNNTNNNGASIELHNKVESVTRLETEAKANLTLSNQNIEGKQQNDISQQTECLDNQSNDAELMVLNQNLSEEISKLTYKVNELEKEKKALMDQMKRQDRKRKKSQRNDNNDDYDTLAREVVTYKLEVDQLRGENNGLHERVMELDDSEKNLIEQNEQLKCDLERLKSCNKPSDKEMELVEKLKNLESIERDLRKELLCHVEADKDVANPEYTKQPSVDSAYESGREIGIKETADKSIGTEDFMEGVMGSQEQGKPVSSMFQRIQALEADNQDLEQKLSVLTATDAQVRQLSDKVKALEENEDSLMERVMELEDEEDRLNLELKKLRKHVSTIPELEEQLNQLEDKEKELNDTKEKLETELDTLKSSIKTSDLANIATGDIAIRLATVQKLYEDEKKKVEALLKGEEKWMKSVASEKKAVRAIEEELTNTQEKLEELQTDYELKLSEKDESIKQLKDEMNKLLREREVLKKKLQEFENVNNDLEDEVTACKISESRMFHRHQQLITQNEELVSKLAKLAEMVPHASREKMDSVDGLHELLRKDNSLMSENPDLVSENPLTSSIFTEQELDVLRSKTPDSELLGSMPLDMLRKIQDFDARETNYQTKIKELENRNMKSMRKLKVLQVKEKDLKHEIKELQLELLRNRDSTPTFRTSVSSFDQDKSESDDGTEVDSGDDLDTDIFKADDTSHYDSMTEEQLLLSVKLLEEQLKQEHVKVDTAGQTLVSLKQLLQSFGELLAKEPLEAFNRSMEKFETLLHTEDVKDVEVTPQFTTLLAALTGLKQRLEEQQAAEEILRKALADKEQAHELLSSQSCKQIEELESQINTLTSRTEDNPSITKSEEPLISQSVPLLQNQVGQSDSLIDAETQTDSSRLSSPERDNLGTSQIITIDVPPTLRTCGLDNLGYSETIKVNVPPSNLSDHDIEYNSDVYQSTYNSPTMRDKAEDVLRQRIRELEKLDKHLKQQVQDLEADREELHIITRKDKNIIHEQNVQLRELQLSQRNLQEQIRNFEESESSLYSRLDEIENELENKDDHIRHLEILEQRLKDLVKQYKLDEKILVTKSATLETSMKEMSVKEETLKEKVQNLESEKNAFCERSEYLQTRLKEIENAELDLAQRAKSQESVVQSLQNSVIELETFGANAQNRVMELEQANFELQQRLHHAMTENSPMSKQASSLQHTCDKLEQELSSLHDSELRLRQENEELEKNERTLQEKVKVLQLKGLELETRVRDLSENEAVFKDRVAKLQRSENTLKYRVQELENSGIQAPTDLESSLRENNKLPRTLEDCQRRIIMLQASNAELQERIQQSQTGSVELQQGTKVTRPQMNVAGSRLSPGAGEITVDPLRNPAEEMMTQTTTGNVQTKPQGHKMTRDQMMDELMMNLKVPNVRNEDDQWKEIESRMEVQQGRGNEQWINIGKATSMYAADRSTKDRSPNRDEVLELHVALQSETESQLNSQNDTDSGRRIRDNELTNQILPHHQGGVFGQVAPPPPQFGPIVGGQAAEYSFVESLNGHFDGTHRQMRQGHMTHQGHAPSVTDSIADSGRGTASVSLANFGTTLKERIANIERQLSTRESDSAREFTNEMDITSWKAKVLESNRKLEVLEKDNKYYKEEINKLERELEEKSRQYLILEAFLNSVETVLKQQDGDDEGMLGKIEKEVENVRLSLADASQRPSDIATDPAALNTELSKKERELSAKRNEVDSLMCELRQWQQECRTIEDMRSNALDSLRGLEVEVNELQEADKQFKQLKDQYNALKGQFLKLVEAYQNVMVVQQKYEDLLQEKDDLDIEVTGLRSKVKLLEGQLQVLDGTRREKKEMEDKWLELKEKISQKNLVEIEKSALEKNIGNITQLLSERMKKVEALTEEVFELRKKLSSVERDNYRLKQHNIGKTMQLSLNDKITMSGKGSTEMDYHTKGKIAESCSQGNMTQVKVNEADNGNDSNGNHGNTTMVFTNDAVDDETVNHAMSITEEPNNHDGMTDRETRLDEEKRRQSPQSTATLRARIIKLTNLCNEKDMLIKKLVEEMKRLQAGEEPSSLLDELLGNHGDGLHHRLSRTSSHSSLDSGEHAVHLSDTELLHDSSPRHTPIRPRSADIYQHRNLGYRHHGSNPRISANRNGVYSNQYNNPSLNNDRNNRRHMSMSSLNRSRDGMLTSPRIAEGTPLVAIADYDPNMFSQSGHPRLELFLKEGDFVTVMGPADKNGYFEAEVNGMIGLVPASYLQPIPPLRRAGSAHVPGHLNASPERIAQMYSALRGAHQQNVHVPYTILGDKGSKKMLKEIVDVEKLDIPLHDVDHTLRADDDIGEGMGHHLPANGYTNGAMQYPNTAGYISHVQTYGPPQTPEHFRVEKIIGNSSLMLSWQHIPLDNKGCNNGVKITGYRIYKNNKVLAHPRGAHTSKSIIENIDIHAHHRFGIATISADGQVSELSEIMYEGVEEVSDENSDTESEMDMSTVLDQDDYKHGPKRTFMAVYDYDPTKNSPQDHPTSELAFKAGDVITVFGRQRADGFYHGQINGNQGLVPAFFIEEVPQPPPRTKKLASKNKQAAKEQKSEESRDQS